MDNTDKNSVLVVDDDKESITAISHMLTPEYTVYEAKNGRDAIGTAEEYLPDVILLDVIMPDMDGYEVLSALKESNKTRYIPVIFITGLDDNVNEEKGLALGVTDYINKPLHEAIIKSRISHQIQIIRQIRTIERLNIDLENALITAEAANRAKSVFLANMSHEIRAPINAIVGIAEILMQDETLPPKVIEGICEIYGSSDLLLRIINDILDLSSIEADKLELAIEKYEAASLINDTALIPQGKNDDKALGAGVTENMRQFRMNLTSQLKNAVALQSVAKKAKPKEEEYENIDENKAYLREKLLHVQMVCEVYDFKAADEAMAELRQKKWSAQTKKNLDTISRHLLHGDYEEAASAAKGYADII